MIHTVYSTAPPEKKKRPNYSICKWVLTMGLKGPISFPSTKKTQDKKTPEKIAGNRIPLK